MSYRVLVNRVSTPDEQWREGDTVGSDELDEESLVWLLATGRIEPTGDGEPAKPAKPEVECPVDGCDYTGTERGLAMHTSRSHGEED